MSTELTLGQLLSRAISNSNKISNASSPNDSAVQELLKTTLADLTLASSLISHLGVLSTNESIEEVNTRSLRCLLVHSFIAQLHLAHHTNGTVQRLDHLQQARDHFGQFIQLVDSYDVVPREQRSTFAGPQASDPARRRDSKIAQFKAEKELKSTLETLRSRRRQRRTNSQTAPRTSSAVVGQRNNENDDDDDDGYASDDEDAVRPIYLNVIKLAYLRAHVELGSIDQEIELLKHAMAMSDLPSSSSSSSNVRNIEPPKAKEDESSWRLDKLRTADKNGPLLDPKGKVLRPFTILPSSTSMSSDALSTRLRFEQEVFRESWNLPTMTIDEFLDQERERGNILQGGGPNSSEAVDQARADERALEEEDTSAGYDRDEAGLAKARQQDDWRDSHKRGEGNRMNRG